MRKIFIIVFVLLGQFANAQLITQGLKSSYPLNTDATDSYGNQDGFTFDSPSPTTNRTSEQDKALNFNGFSSYAVIPSNLDGINKTINIWFYADTITSEIGTIVSMDNGFLSNGLILLGVQRQFGQDKLLMSAGEASSTYDIPNLMKTWHMLTITVENETAIHYLDGDSIGTNFNRKINSIDGQVGLTLATSRALFNRFFEGKLDDLLLYDRALSSQEIKYIYQQTLTNTFVDDKKLGNVNVYPNPADNFIKVSFDQKAKTNTIELYNAIGQKVLAVNTNKNNYKMDVSSLNEGMYTLVIVDEKKSIVGKSKVIIK